MSEGKAFYIPLKSEKYPSRKDELKRKFLEFIEKAGSVAGAGEKLDDLRQRLEEDRDFASILEFLPFNYR